MEATCSTMEKSSALHYEDFYFYLCFVSSALLNIPECKKIDEIALIYATLVKNRLYEFLMKCKVNSLCMMDNYNVCRMKFLVNLIICWISGIKILLLFSRDFLLCFLSWFSLIC